MQDFEHVLRTEYKEIRIIQFAFQKVYFNKYWRSWKIVFSWEENNPECQIQLLNFIVALEITLCFYIMYLYVCVYSYIWE